MGSLTENLSAITSEQSNVKICSACGRLLPISKFGGKRGGGHKDTCKECAAAALRETRKKNRAQIQARILGFDSMFDGKQPVEVIEIMSRAKKWLEARGYEIVLKGVYTMKKDIKFT